MEATRQIRAVGRPAGRLVAPPIVKLAATVRMARRYGHIGQTPQPQAVDALKEVDFEGDGAQNWAQSQRPRLRQLAN